MITAHLPWPTDTSLNSRLHWAKRSSANRDHELDGRAAAIQAARPPLSIEPPYHLTVTFCPPDKRRRDLDNLLGRIKKQIDGMCGAWGFDDCQIKVITLRWGYPVDGGDVVICLSGIEHG